MKKFLVLLLIMGLTCFIFSSCQKKTVDKRVEVQQLVDKGEYALAKQKLISLRGLYPNDKKLIALEKECDKKTAESYYKKYWDEAEKTNDPMDWIEAMLKIKKIENNNKKMVEEWIKKATDRAISAGAEKYKDAKLLGLLNKLTLRYQVITPNDRLMYITMFVKEGRFPIKEWEGTFIKKYPELMDPETGEFVGYPKPEKPEKKGKK
jgi:hypothetical protein